MVRINKADGTRIASWSWPGEDGGGWSPKDGEIAYIMTHFHGDRDDDWIIVEKDGKEVQRTNTRYVDTIVWLQDADRPKEE